MRNMNPNRELEKVLADQASHWVTVLQRQATREELADFSEWIRASPQHIREFLTMVAIEKALHGVDIGRQYGLHELTQPDEGSNVVALAPRPALEPRRSASVRFSGWRWRRGVALAMAASLIAVAVLFGAAIANLLSQSRRFTTEIGEQRSIELQDGSVIQLNTGSRIDVRFSASERDIRLSKGEALFKVAHDPARPFRVRTDDAVIQALGTQFNVYRRQDGTTVSVLEGRVRISKQDAKGETGAERATGHSRPKDDTADGITGTNLGAGEAARIAPGGAIAHPVAADVSNAVAWRQRRLVFQEDSLADMAQEFNRYNSSLQFRVEGHDVARRHYTGVFDADDPESLVQLLATESDLTIERQGGTIIIRERH